VTVNSGGEVVNDRYMVRCAEGVVVEGAPVTTNISSERGDVYLPIVLKQTQ
jgi:hypothetical protein